MNKQIFEANHQVSYSRYYIKKIKQMISMLLQNVKY